MPKPKSAEEFRACLFSGKHTLIQLERKLKHLPEASIANVLLGIFAEASDYKYQEIAGELLVSVFPECHVPLAEILRSIAANWSVSVEQVPTYLRGVFGQAEVIAAATQLAAEFPASSQEAQAMRTVIWWLNGKNANHDEGS